VFYNFWPVVYIHFFYTHLTLFWGVGTKLPSYVHSFLKIRYWLPSDESLDTCGGHRAKRRTPSFVGQTLCRSNRSDATDVFVIWQTPLELCHFSPQMWMWWIETHPMQNNRYLYLKRMDFDGDFLLYNQCVNQLWGDIALYICNWLGNV
jgi:hypothetical protein